MCDDIVIFFSLEKRECSELCLSTILSSCCFSGFFFSTDLSGFPETESESQSETETESQSDA